MKGIAETGCADIRAILEPQADMCRRACELAPSAGVFTSFDELLGCDIDGLIIATPSALHAHQATAALERGIAVFCQKPLGRNAQETWRAIESARSADRLLKVDLCYRFLTGGMKIRDLIRQGAFGEVFDIELIFHNAYGPDKAWFYDPKLSGGGCLTDLGIHLVDLGLWMADFPRVERVHGTLLAKGRHFLGRNSEVEDFATATMELASGANVRIACSWNAHAGTDAVIEMTVYGSRGGAKLSNVNGSFFDFKAEHFSGTKRTILCEPPDDWGPRAAVDWLRQLCTSNRFDPEIERLGSVAEVLDRIYES